MAKQRLIKTYSPEKHAGKLRPARRNVGHRRLWARLPGHALQSLRGHASDYGWPLWSGRKTGLIFVRFSRPTARIKISNVAVVAPFDGFLTLMIRLVNLRHHAIGRGRSSTPLNAQ